jgi:hypothetical protein
LSDPAIPALVRLDLIAPKFRIRPWKVFAPTAVPEAPVNENRNLAPWPSEIWFPLNGPVLTVSPYPGSPHQLCNGQLGRRVAA